MDGDIIDFLRHLRLQVASTTYHRKHWQLQSFLNYLKNHQKHFTDVNRFDVTTFIGGLHCSRSARQQICCVIREFYDFLQWKENPAADIQFKPDTFRKLPHVPGKAAMDAIINKLCDDTTELALRDRLMVELAYGSGLRRDELKRADIDDVDIEEKTICVTGKGSKERIVPLTDAAAKTVRHYLELRHASRGPLLTTSTGRRISHQTIYNVLKCKAGLKPHQFRHACATHMLQNGCSIRIVQEILGHSKLSSTQIYTHIDKKQLAQIIEQKHPRANSYL